MRRLLAEGVVPEEIAVLTRTNRETQEWAAFLAANGIGVESKASADALSSEAVTLALDLLEVVSDPGVSEEKVIRLARSGIFDIDPADVLKINRALYKMNYVRKDRLKFLDAVSDPELLIDIGVGNPVKFSDFYAKIAAAAPENVQLYEDFKRIFESVGFLEFVEKR